MQAILEQKIHQREGRWKRVSLAFRGSSVGSWMETALHAPSLSWVFLHPPPPKGWKVQPHAITSPPISQSSQPTTIAPTTLHSTRNTQQESPNIQRAQTGTSIPHVPDTDLPPNASRHETCTEYPASRVVAPLQWQPALRMGPSSPCLRSEAQTRVPVALDELLR